MAHVMMLIDLMIQVTAASAMIGLVGFLVFWNRDVVFRRLLVILARVLLYRIESSFTTATTRQRYSAALHSFSLLSEHNVLGFIYYICFTSSLVSPDRSEPDVPTWFIDMELLLSQTSNAQLVRTLFEHALVDASFFYLSPPSRARCVTRSLIVLHRSHTSLRTGFSN